MATWQFNIHFIPQKALLKRYGYVPKELSTDGTLEDYLKNSNLENDSGAFLDYSWLDLNLSNEHLLSLLNEFGSLQEWTKANNGLKCFGNTETNDILMSYDDKTKRVECLNCRLNIRQLDNNFIDKIISLANRFDCLLMDGKGRLFKPELPELLNAIKFSNANRFVNGTQQFLSDLSSGNLNLEL